ncbi:MAG: hypothetical protein ACR2IE_12545 [Candidatus Sumerlaeaceae bacterium]
MNVLTNLGTLPLLILQIVVLLMVLAAWVKARSLNRSGMAATRQLVIVLSVGLVFAALASLLSGAALFQEQTGRNLGVSGGIASDARAWLRQHGTRPKDRTDVGQNIRTLADAVTFLKAHQGQLSSAGTAKLEELSRVPEKPKRLLTVGEETQYFQAADDGYNFISGLAGTQTDPATAR